MSLMTQLEARMTKKVEVLYGALSTAYATAASMELQLAERLSPTHEERVEHLSAADWLTSRAELYRAKKPVLSVRVQDALAG